MLINYEYYQIFYYVAQNKNITAAANQLFLSQSTVSRAIQNLEKELNCTLFLRSQKGMELTSDGIYLFNHVKKAVAEISNAENHLHSISALSEGFLRIGVTEMTLNYYLLPYLQEFKDNYPGVNISLSFQTKRVIQELNNGLLDIAIMTTPVPGNDTVRKYSLRSVQDVLIGGSQYRKYAGREVSFLELDNEDFIVMEKGTSTRKYVRQLCEQYQINVRKRFEVCSLSLILSMVERNMGLSILPEVYLRDYDGTDIYQINLIQPLPAREICALISTEYPVHPVRDTFLERLIHE